MGGLSSTIPLEVYLSFSGGVDSHYGYHFLKQGRRKISLIHFNHGTRMAATYEYHVRAFARIENVPLTVVKVAGETEAEWRRQRYDYLGALQAPVVTCHHYDDNVENRLMRQRDIPAVNGNIIRPFLNVRKKEIVCYADRHMLQWVEDPTNQLPFCQRNIVRNELIPLARSIGVKL